MQPCSLAKTCRRVFFIQNCGRRRSWVDFARRQGWSRCATRNSCYRMVPDFRCVAVFLGQAPRANSGFTLLFEAFVLQLVKVMPVLAAARLVGEHDTLVWRILHHYVDSARSKANHSSVTQVGIDETAARRGHDYVSLFVALSARKVLFVAPGKDAATVAAFAVDLQAHQGDPQAITEVSADMSPAFIKGVGDHLPNASLTFDKFHVVSLVNEAVDEVRRLERKLHPDLSGTRYIWLKNPANLTAHQEEQIQTFDFTRHHLKTTRAYH